MHIRIFFSLLLTLSSCFVYSQNEVSTYLFVGSYTSGVPAEGIYVYNFNPETGALTEVEREDNIINPSFLCLSSDGRMLYACNETQMKYQGSVSAFKIDPYTGKLTFLNKQSTGGRNPAHVTIDKSDTYVVASNYTDAGICLFKCNEDGSIQPYSSFIEFEDSSVIKGRQDEAHLHSSNFSPNNQYIFSPDLGADKIRVFTLSDKGKLTVVDSLTVHSKKGSGPRHFTFHPEKPFAYCIEELSGTVSFYTYKNGRLHLVNTYPSYEQKQEIYSSADIHISPDGKFLYASNRLDENSISIFNIDPITGALKTAGHASTYGSTPRSFVIDPSGKYLLVANQLSDNLIVYRRSIKTGMLEKISEVKGIKTPSSLKMYQYEL